MNRRFVATPDTCGGALRVHAGTRLTVLDIGSRILAGSWTATDIIADYPHLTPADIDACVDALRSDARLPAKVENHPDGRTMTFDQFGAEMTGLCGPTAETMPRIRRAGFSGMPDSRTV